MDDWECEEPTTPPPRCSAAQLWQKAIAKGADSTDVVGQIGCWAADHRTGRWLLSIQDADFSAWLPDDC